MNHSKELPIFSSYNLESRFYDEIFTKDKKIRDIYKTLFTLFSEFNVDDFQQLNEKAKSSFLNQGITFQVVVS